MIGNDNKPPHFHEIVKQRIDNPWPHERGLKANTTVLYHDEKNTIQKQAWTIYNWTPLQTLFLQSHSKHILNIRVTKWLELHDKPKGHATQNVITKKLEVVN